MPKAGGERGRKTYLLADRKISSFSCITNNVCEELALLFVLSWEIEMRKMWLGGY